MALALHRRPAPRPRILAVGALLLVALLIGCLGTTRTPETSSQPADPGAPTGQDLEAVADEPFEATVTSAAVDLGGIDPKFSIETGPLDPPDDADLVRGTLAGEPGATARDVGFLLLACEGSCQAGTIPEDSRVLARAEGEPPLHVEAVPPANRTLGWGVYANHGATVEQTFQGNVTYLAGYERPTAPEALTLQAQPTPDGTQPPETTEVDDPALGFADPIMPFGDVASFEPSIEVASDGTLYVTAAQGGTTTHRISHSSLLRYSTDGGATWRKLPSPLQVHERQGGFEGDLAVDAQDRVYFVDTYLADNTLSRWTSGPGGPTWDVSRPVQGTPRIDDRPWLAAHGDGVVYYAGNNGLAAGADEVDEERDVDRIGLSVSEDGGRTFQLRKQFEDSAFCVPSASPTDDQEVVAICSHGTESANVSHVRHAVHVSQDRGQTWKSTELRPATGPAATFFPAATHDADGTPFAVWGEGESPTRLFVARRVAGTWQVLNVTPFEGEFRRTWIDAGPDGTVAAVFYGALDAPGPRGKVWHAYALLSTEAEAPNPTWGLSRISKEPVVEGAEAPGDFFQPAFAPDGRLHVVYDHGAGSTASRETYYTHQTRGPNLPP